MTQVVVPDSAASQLATLARPASICDSSGHVLGTFIPGVSYDPALYALNRSPLTPEERERRRKQEGGKTLAEFWAEMKQKYPDEFK
jgi:hypothetical protein